MAASKNKINLNVVTLTKQGVFFAFVKSAWKPFIVWFPQ